MGSNATLSACSCIEIEALSFIARAKQRVQKLKAETLALYLAARHPGTPWHARFVIVIVVAYALSPVDLIPDFIPVLGLVDDLLLLPLGIALAIRLIPSEVMIECRARSALATQDGKSLGRIAGAVVVAIWLALLVLAGVWSYKAVSN